MRIILFISCCFLLSIETAKAVETPCPHPEQVTIAWNIAGRSAVPSILQLDSSNKNHYVFPEVHLKRHSYRNSEGNRTCVYYPDGGGVNNALFVIVSEEHK